MNKQKVRFYISILFITLSLISCSKDDAGSGNKREVKYALTGNFSGPMMAAFYTQSGGTTTEYITALPWNKQITYDNSVSAVAISMGGSGGVSGQTLTLKIYTGGKLQSTTPATADGSGNINVSGPAITFWRVILRRRKTAQQGKYQKTKRVGVQDGSSPKPIV